MEVNYIINNKKLKCKANSSAFVISNKDKGFFVNNLDSQYNGLFINIQEQLFKIIHSIELKDKIKRIKHYKNKVKLEGKYNQEFFFPLKKNSLIYENNSEKYFEIILDIRNINDYDKWGKKYEIIKEKDKIIIKFTKNNDKEIYLVINNIKNEKNYKKINQWIKKECSFDKERGINSENYFYKAIKIKSNLTIFTAHNDKNKAIKESEFIKNNLKKLKLFHDKYHKLKLLNLKSKKHKFARQFASYSLDSLLNDNGFYAGHPWFHQIWSRDELISLKALIIEKEFQITKEILIKNINNITKKGKLPNRIPYSEINSSDSIGWLFLRFYEFIKAIKKEKLFSKYFNKNEFNKITKKLEKTIKQIHKDRLINNLIFSRCKTTWMDTLNREGFCIEIQALQLKCYEIMYRLTKKQKYLDYEEKLKKEVKAKFYDSEKKVLADFIEFNNKKVISNFEFRPNLFIAAYIYPKLFTKKEWTAIIKNYLKELWLYWGGLSTIGIHNPKFKGIDTGHNPSSYHNGDSWFWINNLTAIVLNKINNKVFNDKIKKILDTSSNEILSKGFLGSHAEISDALQLKSRGCFNQTWSNAMFIELIDELF